MKTSGSSKSLKNCTSFLRRNKTNCIPDSPQHSTYLKLCMQLHLRGKILISSLELTNGLRPGKNNLNSFAERVRKSVRGWLWYVSQRFFFSLDNFRCKFLECLQITALAELPHTTVLGKKSDKVWPQRIPRSTWMQLVMPFRTRLVKVLRINSINFRWNVWYHSYVAPTQLVEKCIIKLCVSDFFKVHVVHENGFEARTGSDCRVVYPRTKKFVEFGPGLESLSIIWF